MHREWAMTSIDTEVASARGWEDYEEWSSINPEKCISVKDLDIEFNNLLILSIAHIHHVLDK